MLDFIIKNIFLFSASAMLAIGHFYDDRLVIYGVNLTLIISVFYSISSFLLILKNKNITISVSKFVFYLLLLFIIIFTPINWMIYGINEYGLDKYISFVLIIIPICYISIEVLNKNDIKKLLWILFGVSVTLMMLGYLNYDEISSLRGGRMTVMGGGPIVFSRWMLLAVLIILFMKNKYRKYLYIMIPLFLFMSFTAGSRGPIYSFGIVIFFYFLFSFRKNFFKIIMIFLTGIISITTLSLTENDKGAGSQSTSRVFNVKTGSYSRIDRLDRSVNLITQAPLGVGIGNWAQESNKFSDHQHEDKEYPHNIFLELLNESGIVVFLLFIILLFSLLDSSLFLFYFEEKYNFIRLSVILLVFFFLNAMVSGDIVDNRLMFVMMSFFLNLKLSHE